MKTLERPATIRASALSSKAKARPPRLSAAELRVELAAIVPWSGRKVDTLKTLRGLRS